MNELDYSAKFKKCEYSIPEQIRDRVLLGLIKILGYELRVAWFGGNGKPQTAEFSIVKTNSNGEEL